MSSVLLVCIYWYVLYSRIYKIDIFFSQFPLLGLTSSPQFMYISPIGAAPIFSSMIHSRGAFSKWVTTNLSKQRIYLGVRTCELFLCFAPFVFLGPIVLTSLFSFALHHLWVFQVLKPRMSQNKLSGIGLPSSLSLGPGFTLNRTYDFLSPVIILTVP